VCWRKAGEFLAALSLAMTIVLPFYVGGGWWTCPNGYLIYHGQCLQEVEGPVVEYGCTVRENARGEVIEQTCPSSRRKWVGNVGSFGAPLATAPVSGGVGIVIGVGR
jgi:hypothetical protein